MFQLLPVYRVESTCLFVSACLYFVCVQVVSYEKVLIGEGHCSLIHGLCWAPDSTALATASADGLAK